jgi:TolB-like protein
MTGLRAGLPIELEWIVNKSLSKSVEDRYQHMDEMLVDLKSVQKESEFAKGRELHHTIKFRNRKNIYLYASLALFIVIIFFMGIYFFPKENHLIDSIAVLPLQSLSDDPEQEYFTDGMSDALIAELSKIEALRVISWTTARQYKNAQKPLSDIADELNVDALIEGTVLRAGNEVRITVQLVKTKPEQNLWANNYLRDYKNILFLQSEVAQDIADRIRLKLTSEDKRRITTAKVVNPEAYELYLKGRHFRLKETDESLQRALEYFKQSIAKDSTFAPAHAGLAKIYYLRRYVIVNAKSKSKKAITKALELDDTLSEAHIGLGDILESEWNWLGAEKAYKRAIELNPGNSEAHYEYGNLLYRTGRLQESLTRMKYALELNPLSLLAHVGIARAYYYNRQFNKAVKYNLKALELDKNYMIAYRNLILIYVSKNEINKALGILEKLNEEWTYPYYAGLVYAKMGKGEESLKLIKNLPQQVRGFAKANVYAVLGEKDSAFFWFEKAIEEKGSALWYLKVEPTFDSLRSDPRYEALLRKIGLEP